MEADAIQAHFDQAQTAALTTFASRAIGDDEYKAQFAATLRADFKEQFSALLKENELKSKDACKTHVEKIWAQLGFEGKGKGSSLLRLVLIVVFSSPVTRIRGCFSV